MRVAVDPVTGTLGPSRKPEPSGLLETMLLRNGEDLTPVHHPDGTVSLHLEGRFHSASVAHLDGDGGLRITCVDHPEGAAHALAGGAHPRDLEVK
jgi:hypothetical protein